MDGRSAAYPAAYREQIIAVVRTGGSPKELANLFDPSEQSFLNWLFQGCADRDERPEARTTDLRTELQRLCRDNRQFEIVRDILGSAAAWFARQS